MRHLAEQCLLGIHSQSPAGEVKSSLGIGENEASQ